MQFYTTMNTITYSSPVLFTQENYELSVSICMCITLFVAGTPFTSGEIMTNILLSSLSRNTILIGAVGNTPYIENGPEIRHVLYPACHPDIISVGAVGENYSLLPIRYEYDND